MATRSTSPKIQPGVDTDIKPQLAPNPGFGDQSRVMSSRTWSYASGDLQQCNTKNDIDDRNIFVQEYNRLAQKHGIRLLISEDDEKDADDQQGASPRRSSWLSRTFRRHVSSQSSNTKPDTTVQQKRSIGDVAKQMVHAGKDAPKNEDLQELIRLCGKSFLYLPSEYAPCSLILPTSLRATAHYLIQHGIGTPGVFRIPGSIRIVNEIYDYYSAARDGALIRGTVRNPNLPSHITVTVHDVASAFKKFLATIPGGILGSLGLFDALVAIESQMQGHSESEQTRRDKLRARMIALAVGTVKSQFRRELICAVFGMLCFLGQEGQKMSREGGEVASELMGYNAFGIIFGPLLAGDLLDTYNMKLADPSSGLFLEPASHPKAKKHRKKSNPGDELQQGILTVNKVRVANDVTEMLISNWLEVVKHMRSLNILRSDTWAPKPAKVHQDDILKTSTSDSFVQKQPLMLRNENSKHLVSGEVPMPGDAASRPNKLLPTTEKEVVDGNVSRLYMKRTRPNSYSPATTQGLAFKPPALLLSPMAKESSRDNVLPLKQHQVSGSVNFKAVSKIPVPVASSIGVDTTARSMQPTKKTSEALNPCCNNTEEVYVSRPRFTSQSKGSATANLFSRADGVETRLSKCDAKSLDPASLPSKSPQLGEEQPMGWLGEYLNHADTTRTALELVSENDIPVPAGRTGSQGPSAINLSSGRQFQATGLREHSTVEKLTYREPSGSKVCPPREDLPGIQSDVQLPRRNLGRSRSKTVSTPPARQRSPQETMDTDRKLARRSLGGAVRAMAAMFDNAAKDSSFVPTPLGKLRVQDEFKTPNDLSTYTVNSSPTRSNGSSRSDLNRPTPNPFDALYKGALKRRLRVAEQQETPTRKPLRSLKSNNTGTTNIAQHSSKHLAGMADRDAKKLHTKSVISSEQAQPHNIERVNTRLSNPTKPEMSRVFRLVPDEAGSTMSGGQTGLHRNNQATDAHFKDLRERLYAKEKECNELRDAVIRRGVDISSLTKQWQRASTESSQWKQRAEIAEKRVEAFVNRATRIKEISQSNADKDLPLRAGVNLQASPYRAEGSSSSAHSRDGDVARRTSRTSTRGVENAGSDFYQGDTSSEWSGGTVVRTTPDKSQRLWLAVDELLEFATGTYAEPN